MTGVQTCALPILVVLDGPYLALFGHADVEYLHYHEEVAAEARQFCADDKVVLLYFVKQLAQLALVIRLGPADGFLDPSVDVHILAPAEPVDLEALVLHCLFVAADPDVSVCHSVIRFHFVFFAPLPGRRGRGLPAANFI